MELTQRMLEQFVAVAEELHFGRAAQRLAMTQPPLSQAIARLERAMGITLLERGTRSVRLTAAGAVFAEDATRLLAGHRAAVDRARRTALGLAGELRIGVGTLMSHRYLPDIMRVAADNLPGLHIRLDYEPSTTVMIDMVRADALDIAFVFAPIPDAPGIETTTLDSEYLAAALPEGHRLAGAAAIALHELSHENFVLPSARSLELGVQIQSACRQAGFTPRDYAHSDSATGLLSYVAAGLCVSLVRRMPFPGVVFVPLDNPPPAAETTVIAIHRPKPDLTVRRLLALIDPDGPIARSVLALDTPETKPHVPLRGQRRPTP